MPVARFLRDASGATGATDDASVDATLLAAVKLALRIEEFEGLDAFLGRNIEAAQALTERQAPGAPDAIKTEAIIRACGWFFEGPGLEDQPVTSIWRAAGCEALLSPWTIRRGGPIG